MKRKNVRPIAGVSVAMAIALALVGLPALADTVVIQPSQDNSLYQNFGGEESNGAGPWLFSGFSGCCGERRALMAFDIAAALPAGATVTSVALDLAVTLNGPAAGAGDTYSLYPLLDSWGEGTSDTGAAPGGFGAAPSVGDATWTFRFWNTDAWATPGGDFSGTAAASAPVGFSGGTATWNSAAMAANVQAWLDSPASNFGWILAVDVPTGNAARRFGSRENTDPLLQPALTIDFVSAPECGNGIPETGEECDGGGATADCDADCTFAECGDGTLNPAAGEQCDNGAGNSDDPGAVCTTGCQINPAAPVPTVSQWGMILMSLLLLTAGSLLFGKRSTVLVDTAGGQTRLDGMPHVRVDLWLRALLGVTALVAVVFALIWAATGRVDAVDVTGALLATPILSFLLHLWWGQRQG